MQIEEGDDTFKPLLPSMANDCWGTSSPAAIDSASSSSTVSLPTLRFTDKPPFDTFNSAELPWASEQNSREEIPAAEEFTETFSKIRLTSKDHKILLFNIAFQFSFLFNQQTQRVMK